MRTAQAEGGVALFVLDDDPRADALIATRADLNPMSLRMWRLLCTSAPWTTVIDVGANYGEMILGASLPPTARAFAFEPAPDIAACLRASVAAAEAPVEVVEKAVGATTQSVDLFEDPTWSGTTTATSLRAAAQSRRRRVSMTRLDEFLSERGRQSHERYLIKIDVEGGERQVLEGFRPLLADADLAMFQVEVKHTSDEDLRWMLETFYVHLVSREDLVPVPIASLDDYRLLKDDGAFYPQDAILATHLLGDDIATTRAAEAEAGPETRGQDVERSCDILRAEVDALWVLRHRELERAGIDAETLAEARRTADAAQRTADEARRGVEAAHEVIRDLEVQKAKILASRSWRMTRPIRSTTNRLRGGPT